jgi:hypothetical protein
MFNQPSSLSLVAGSWTTPNGYTIAVDASGNLSGSLDTSGCTSIPPDLGGFVTDGELTAREHAATQARASSHSVAYWWACRYSPPRTLRYSLRRKGAYGVSLAKCRRNLTAT